MKLFKKLFSGTLTYKLYSLFRSIKDYIFDYEYVSDSLYSDVFRVILEKYLKLKVKKDWLGRLYGVINPNLDIDGKVNFSNVIVELDGENTNSDVFVKQWIYAQMNMVKAVFRLEDSGFFDYITCDITHVGPIEHDNYLVVFDLYARKEMAMYFKAVCKQIFIYAVLFGIGYLLYNLRLI